MTDMLNLFDAMTVQALETWKWKPKYDHKGMLVNRLFNESDVKKLYLADCLAGETGELANKIKKYFRLRYFTTAKDIEGDHIPDPIDDPSITEGIELEMGDIIYYLLILADEVGIDLNSAFDKVMKSNRERYQK